MSIYSIDKYISEHPGARVLVLAHGTTVLRSQYYKEIVDLKPAFTYSLIENKADTINNNTQVWAALPQAIQKLKLVRLTCW